MISYYVRLKNKPKANAEIYKNEKWCEFFIRNFSIAVCKIKLEK